MKIIYFIFIFLHYVRFLILAFQNNFSGTSIKHIQMINQGCTPGLKTNGIFPFYKSDRLSGPNPAGLAGRPQDDFPGIFTIDRYFAWKTALIAQRITYFQNISAGSGCMVEPFNPASTAGPSYMIRYTIENPGHPGGNDRCHRYAEFRSFLDRRYLLRIPGDRAARLSCKHGPWHI